MTLRGWSYIVIQAALTGGMSALMAPAFGNDPLDMFFRGFCVGALFSPVMWAVQAAVLRRVDKDRR